METFQKWKNHYINTDNYNLRLQHSIFIYDTYHYCDALFQKFETFGIPSAIWNLFNNFSLLKYILIDKKYFDWNFCVSGI